MTTNERAQALYEEACARLRRSTIAAWVAWDDAPIDCQLTWIARAQESA